MSGLTPDLAKTLGEAVGEALQSQLKSKNIDVVEVVPIPSHGDRMVRLRTIQEVLEDFENSTTDQSASYIIHLKPSIAQATASKSASVPQTEESDGIYLPTGKLNSSYLLKNAELLHASGEYTLARNIYKAILQSGEKTGYALAGIARAYEAEGKLEDARINYEEAIAYLPQADWYQNLGSLLIRMGKDQSAAEVMERSLALKDIPSSVRYELHKACGNCWTRSGRALEAERHYQSALKINPSADEIRANLGALYLKTGKIADARKHFQDAVASNPRNDKALSGLGSCALAQGEKRAAHDYFAKALSIDLNNATAVFYLVKCAYEMKSYATAARIVEDYIDIAPVNTSLLYSLAGLQFHLGRMDQAQATTTRLLDLAPDHTGAKDLLHMIGKYSGALR